MIRVLEIVGTLERTGPSGQLALLASRLSAEGFEVRVFSLAGTGPLAAPLIERGVQLFDRPERRHAGLRTLAWLRQAILDFSPHLVHTWPSAPNPWTGTAPAATATHGQAMRTQPPAKKTENSSLIRSGRGNAWTGNARAAAREENAWTGNARGMLAAGANFWGAAAATQVGVRRIVVSERLGFRPRQWPRPLTDRLLRRWARRCVVNSPVVWEDCRQAGWSEDRLCLIPNGVAPNRFDPTDARERILREFSLPSNVRLIGAVGPLESRKRLKDLIWSADQLNLVRDDCYLLVIGDGPHRWRLERYCDQVVLRDRVIFLGSRSDATRLIAGLDCLWIASQRESVPNCVLEGMAAGVPVVASDLRAHRALVIPGETGLLVPLGSRPGYARKTLGLLADETLRRSIGRQGRQHVERHYSVDTMVRRYMDLYRSLVDA